MAIAFIIAIGSGVYAGLSSMTEWRRASYDASYEALNTHDLLVTTADGTFVPEGALRSALDSVDDPDRVEVAEERLVLPTQVDASALADDVLLVPGRLVGVQVDGDGPMVDSLEVEAGRGLSGTDDGTGAVVLDSHFADHHGLPDTGEIELSSGVVEYVGTGYSPEYFVIAGEQGSFLAQAGFAVMFAPLATAQELLGAEGQVNQLAVRLTDGVDAQAARDELEAVLAEVVPDAATEVAWIEEDRIYRQFYDDIDGDQKVFSVFAVLILAGAAFAAFNLTGRIVEAQRREIGVGMAIGLPRTQIAIRPVLVGIEVALIGVVAGVGVGLLIAGLMSDLNLAFVPLPVWIDDFQVGPFLRGALLALGLVFVATVLPVWRAVRVDPVEAIHTRPGLTKSGGFAPQLSRVPLPGNSIQQFPFRNVVRQPRRTLLTVFGIAAAIAVAVALFGMIDSFLATIDRGEAEILGDSPERVIATLDFFYPTDAEEVDAIVGLDGVASAEPVLDVGGALIGQDGEEIETFISVVDLESEQWRPTAASGSLSTDEPAVVIAQKAADDLGVEPGGTVTLRHPVREGTTGYTFVESEVPVAAVHANPYRFMTYMDLRHADLMGLDGIVNAVSVVPEADTTAGDLKQSLFGRPGVAAVEGVSEVAGGLRDALEDFLGFLYVIQVFVLLMALLIAFNSTSISSDERRREHATMFAFGLPTRSVMAMTVLESFMVGVAATALGILVGRGIIGWMVNVLLPDTNPDLGIVVDVSAGTYLTAAVLGIVAVSIAPLLTARRLRRMDIPSTLRIVE